MYENTLLTSKEVAKLLNVSQSYAYKIIHQLNKELEQNGYLTIRGKVDAFYLQRRFFPSYDKEVDHGSV